MKSAKEWMTFISLHDEELVKAAQMDVIHCVNDFLVANFKGQQAYIELSDHLNDLLGQVYNDVDDAGLDSFHKNYTAGQSNQDLDKPQHKCVCLPRDVCAFGCKCGGI